MQVVFKKVAIGQSFVLHDETLEKVQIVMKGCCIPEYNAIGPDGAKHLVTDMTLVEVEGLITTKNPRDEYGVL